MVDAFQGRDLIVRSESLSELIDGLSRADPSAIKFIQLLAIPTDSYLLEGCAEGLPVEVVLTDPANQYQQLYGLVSLLDTHPVRIAIPVVNGFGKAVKLAVSLDFAVKLELGQPDEVLIGEVESILDVYLHRSYVRQPIEFFQTMLRSFYSNEPVSLWEIAEENPEQVRYITDDGGETISRRFARVKLNGDLANFVNRLGEDLVSEGTECHDCEFFNRCGGYFKWPDKTYRCDGVKRLFRTLATATDEMSRDLATYETMGVQQS